MNYTLKQGVQVLYKTWVLNPDGSVFKERDWKRNLVLNVGLDMPASYSWAQCFNYVALGEGTKPVKRDSGTILFTRAGNVVTADSSFFEVQDVGRLLKFDSGEEMAIASFTDTTHVVVSVTGALAASQGTVWYVNETGHQIEFLRFNTKATGAGENGSSFFAGTWTHKRTFLSASFASSKVVREIGWSPNGTSGANLFGRDLVPSGGDSVAVGQKYKVEVKLSVTYSPKTSTACVDVGNNGFNTSGTYGVEYPTSRTIDTVNSNGDASGPNDKCGEPANAGNSSMTLLDYNSVIVDASDALAIKPGSNLAYQSYGRSAYSSGSKFVDISTTFGENAAISTNIRSVAFEQLSGYAPFFRVAFATPQTKDGLHTLSFTFRFSWDRVVVN